MGVSGLDLLAKRGFSLCLGSLVFGKFFEAAARTNGINMALGNNGAEPGLQRTATVEVAEERAVGAFAVRQSVQISKHRIAELTAFPRSGRAAGDCARAPAA